MEGYEIYRERDDTPDADRAEEFRARYSKERTPIKFLGVWDTVGALGVPLEAMGWLNDQYAFHDTGLSRSIENAYHAVAIDEHRPEYEPTLWDTPPKEGQGDQKVEQVWFVGAHSDVGGGSGVTLLSDITLRWMQEKVQLGGEGLEIDAGQVPDIGDGHISESGSDSYGDFLGGFYRFWRWLTLRGRHYRPVKQTEHGRESVDDTALEKMRVNPSYRPKNRGL